MSIYSNTSYHTAINTPLTSEGQTPSIYNRVEGVAFDALFSKNPLSESEQLRFELNECKKTGSSYYTIVTWKDKRYRITVHNKKRTLAYSEGDWQRIEDRITQVLDKVQNSKHFFKGTLHLHVKTKNKWKVTYENNAPLVEHFVNEKTIREFKNLLEKQINPTNRLPTGVHTSTGMLPQKLKRSLHSSLNYNPTKKENSFFEFPKKILEKVKHYLRPLKSNANEAMEKTERKKESFELTKERLFFPNNLDNFDDLSSSDGSSISFFEKR
ncbi:MAG: hypothetical protein LBC45_01295 [Chlamydiales bacterium]|jgi:hypothetical protein|nr:hypothetical protein [Chlamydiales bacterium]